jgi:hypothetical protein
MNKPLTRAQGTTEYALIISLVVLAGLVMVALFGRQLGSGYQKAVNAMNGTSGPASVQSIATDFMGRTMIYHQSTGGWPPTWGNGRFTALGLNPGDYQNPVDGILWNPNGENIGLANASGDNLQVYVKDTSGNLLHLYDGWNIWCRSSDGICFYHSIGGVQVDLSTVVVTGN